MNINKVYPLVLTVAILSARQLTFASQDSNNTVQLSKGQVAHVEANVARAIIWQLYWCDGKTVAQIRRKIAESPSTPFTLCRIDNEDLCVYLDAYQWKVVLTKIGREYYGFDVTEYKMLAGDAADHRRSYLEALQNEPIVLSKGALMLRPEDLSVLTFETQGQKLYGVVTNMLARYLITPEESKMLKERIKADKVHGPLVVHIGGFSKQSPWVYYHIEGIPYVGTMLIDPSSGEFIHDDFLYIYENYREDAYKNMQRAIDKSGAKFPLKLPT